MIWQIYGSDDSEAVSFTLIIKDQRLSDGRTYAEFLSSMPEPDAERMQHEFKTGEAAQESKDPTEAAIAKLVFTAWCEAFMLGIASKEGDT